jgi:hypothetical protein
MHKSVQSRPGKHQQGHDNGHVLPAKHLQSLDKFRQHGSSHFGDDSGNDCLIGALIVPN